MPRYILRHAILAGVVLVAMLAQETWALAGTTGGMNGVVTDAATAAPIAGAVITALAPSQTASTTSDSAGHFTFVSLVPDTYTVSVQKEGYTGASQAGVSVFADASAVVALKMEKSLKTIAQVTSRAAGDLVHSGTTADVYSVNAATQSKISALGGGGSLNSAYAAIASVPGITMPLNQAGYFQTVHIRGGDYDQVGYELDGVPVNRSFDNYPSGSLSSLGMQELQVYTGATPANSEGQGLAGYVNQVIKSGTFPGYANLTGGIGSPAFYHKVAAEAGGATPNRSFSYYVGIGGYDQAFRYTDNNNAAGFPDLGAPLVQITGPCPNISLSGCYANGFAGPGGYVIAPYPWASQSDIADRDIIANVHFALPHKNDSGHDDVQILWDSGMLHNSWYESTNDSGGLGNYPANSNNPGGPFFLDGFQWTGAVGTLLPSNASQFVQPYYFPNQPQNRPAFSFTGIPTAIPPDQRDTIWNNQEIVKLQYQKNIGTSAYLRFYGYTYFSDWLQNGPVCTFSAYSCFVSPDYELSSHTRGASLSFADQIDPKNLFNVEANFTTANSTRDNNTQMANAFGSRSLAAVLVNPANTAGGTCYSANPGGGVATPTTCSPDVQAATFLTWPCVQSASNPLCSPASISPAAAANSTCGGNQCRYYLAENSLYATYNTVTPQFLAFSAQDQWRSSDKLLLNLGVRFDQFRFEGANTAPNDPARQFWFTSFNADSCVSKATGAYVDKTQIPGYVSGTDPASIACSSFGSNYSPTNLQNASSVVNTYNVFQPRLSGTYTFNPDTVVRFSAGRYAEPPNTAYEQYDTLQENLAYFLADRFYQLGFTTPSHQVVPPKSDNFDLSLEKRFANTDWSFKLTPFLRKTSDQIQLFYLNQQTSFVSGLNVGKQTSEGVEFQLNKGDFNRNGISGSLALTYTHSYINYSNLQNGSTIFTAINNTIQNYNAYTKACATHSASASLCGTTSNALPAAACYTTAGTPDPACGAGDIGNPYWNAPVSATLNPTADYATYDPFPFTIGTSATSFAVPYVATLILNYKHDKYSITPSFQFVAGNRYGAPETTPGIDPASGCGALAPVTGDPRYPFGNPGPAGYDATTCAGTITIPDQYSGNFDTLGAFVNPSQFLMNLQVSYDVSPRVTLVGTFANIVNTCFGGSKEPWTIANSNVCSYGILNTSGLIPPVGNVYNPGATIQRAVQYPYAAYLGSYNVNSSSSGPLQNKTPFNFFLEANVKL